MRKFSKRIVKSITFDMRFTDDNGVVRNYKPVLKYKKEDGLTVEELHWEDNDSWTAYDVDEFQFSIQVIGDGDTGTLFPNIYLYNQEKDDNECFYGAICENIRVSTYRK